jgi:NAD(P)-dependent dehydrogenase (short-subunit alcohol dehydrogenase family)
VVTGTSRNIGGAVAAGLATEGAWVACNDIDPEVAEECAESIRLSGGTAMAIPADITSSEMLQDALDSVITKWGRIDVLVNNAVAFNKKGLLSMSIGEFRRQLDVILVGTFACTQRVARQMVEGGRGGSIINVLSTAAWQGEPGNVGYSTGKSGLINFTRSIAMELAQYQIRVNSLTPTATVTNDPEQMERAEENRQRGWRMEFASLVPLGRLPTPSDYVPATIFLASDDSAMITGTDLRVDGGALAKYWSWVPRDF